MENWKEVPKAVTVAGKGGPPKIRGEGPQGYLKAKIEYHRFNFLPHFLADIVSFTLL
jgi:hypothetical protein